MTAPAPHPQRCETCEYYTARWSDLKRTKCPLYFASIDENELTPKNKLFPGVYKRLNFTRECGCASHSSARSEREKVLDDVLEEIEEIKFQEEDIWLFEAIVKRINSLRTQGGRDP